MLMMATFIDQDIPPTPTTDDIGHNQLQFLTSMNCCGPDSNPTANLHVTNIAMIPYGFV